jgi:hypothetical protein
MACRNDHWWVLTLDETDNNSGPFVASLLEYLHQIIQFNHIIIRDAEGAYTHRVVPDNRCVYYVYDTLLPPMREVVQFDWCDIFCFEEKDDIPDGDLYHTPYPDIIRNTVMSLQVCDSSWIDIFIYSKSLADRIKKDYEVTRCYEGLLSDFHFAY